MPIRITARFLFPGEADWQRRKKFRVMVWVIFVAVCLGCLIGGMLFLFAIGK